MAITTYHHNVWILKKVRDRTQRSYGAWWSCINQGYFPWKPQNLHYSTAAEVWMMLPQKLLYTICTVTWLTACVRISLRIMYSMCFSDEIHIIHRILICHVFFFRLSQFQTPTLCWCLWTQKVEESRVNGKQFKVLICLCNFISLLV